MAGLPSSNYTPWGPYASEHMHYTQAIRLPNNRLVLSGQGGWSLPLISTSTHLPPAELLALPNLFPSSIDEEIDTAFANVDIALRDAGGKGWSQVYLVRTYSTDIPAQSEALVRNLKKWMPGHRAVWTQLGVKELGAKGMRVEVEVEAWDGEGVGS
jgi:enamine deaminase RidA (YjgF/YER057c/UK114 family)